MHDGIWLQAMVVKDVWFSHAKMWNEAYVRDSYYVKSAYNLALNTLVHCSQIRVNGDFKVPSGVLPPHSSPAAKERNFMP